nr:hypothetical protein HAGR004_01400 [Bdellovibrio sp. HAGR004]
MNQGPLILPFFLSPSFVGSETTNSFQSICIPVKKFKQYDFRYVGNHELKAALIDRSKLSEHLSSLIWQWIREVKASPEAKAVISHRQVPDLKSYGRMRFRKAFRRNTAIHIPIEPSEIQIVGNKWRQARKTVRVGLLTKILWDKQSFKPIKLNTLCKYNEDISTTKRLSDNERAALAVELKGFNLKSNVYLLLNRRRTGPKYLPNGSKYWDWFSSTGSKTQLELMSFISVDVDGRDLKRRFPHLSDQDIVDRIVANIEKLPLKPDIVIATGSHLSFHFHWSIKAEQFGQQLTSEDRARQKLAKDVQVALVDLIDGDHGAIGINRPWRLPGTFNFKSKDDGLRQCLYCVGSRTFEDALKSPKYTLDELCAVYVTADSVTDEQSPLMIEQSALAKAQPYNPIEEIDRGWEEKFDEVIGWDSIESLSATDAHNVTVLFRHIHQFRHRPNEITFPKKGILRAIRGKKRPYPPFHRALGFINSLSSKPIIEMSEGPKWRSNPKFSKSTEYSLTDYGREALQSRPGGRNDVQSVLETLYMKGKRHNDLHSDAMILFKNGWHKKDVIAALTKKNRLSAGGPDGCAFDEVDLFRQVDRAEDFVQKVKTKRVR